VSSIESVRVPNSLRLPLGRPAAAIAARMQGPGGYYNAGNLIGLSVALGVQFASASDGSARTIGDVLIGYLIGSPSAGTLTAATIIFLISGELYHRAWRNGPPNDQLLTRLADILSAIGVLALTISLIYIGQSYLAIASGLLIVAGKLGTAVLGDSCSGLTVWRVSWPDPFRTVVLAGRVPGILAPIMEIVRQLSDGPADLSLVPLIQPAVLIICQLLWIKADLLLLSAARSQRAAQPAGNIKELRDAKAL
jgi:hypothetical protein